MNRWDCVIFADELELLHTRFVELDAVVDAFLVVEATRTLQGDEKPLRFVEHRGLFAPWHDKIVHHIVDDLRPAEAGRGGAGYPLYMQREGRMRDEVANVLRGIGAPRDDLVWCSDADEIPRADVVAATGPDDLRTTDGELPLVYELDTRCFALDWRWPGAMLGTTCSTVGYLVDVGGQDVRADRDSYRHLRADGGRSPGWHLTWMGGPHRWRRKADSFSHFELAGKLTDEFLLRCWTDGWDVNGVKLDPTGLDDLPAGMTGLEPHDLDRDPAAGPTFPEWWCRAR